METGDEARRGCQPVSLESVWGECGRSLGHLSTAHLLTCSPAHAQLDADTYSTCRCGRGKRGEDRGERAKGKTRCSAVRCCAVWNQKSSAPKKQCAVQVASPQPPPPSHPRRSVSIQFNSIRLAALPIPSTSPLSLCLAPGCVSVYSSTHTAFSLFG